MSRLCLLSPFDRALARALPTPTHFPLPWLQRVLLFDLEEDSSDEEADEEEDGAEDME